MRADDVRARVVAVAVAHRRPVGVERLLLGRALRVDDRLERLVLDDDRLGRAARLLGMLGRDERDRLAVVADAVDREHRLVGELEPVGLAAGHVVVREHGVDAGHRDAPARCRSRRCARARAGCAACGPRASRRRSRSLEYANSPVHLRGRVRPARRPRRSRPRARASASVCTVGHGCAAAAPRRRSSGSRCSGRGCRRAPRGSRRRSGSACARAGRPSATTRPGVQKPHCTAPAATNASCTRCSAPSVGEPLDRDDLVPVGLRGEHEARADERAVEEHGARAALALLAGVLRAGQAELLAQREEQALAAPDVGLARARR